MKFLSMIIDLPRSQYEIVYQPTLLQRLAVWLKIALIISLSLWAGVEHLDFVFNRQIEALPTKFEALAINLMTHLITPKGRVYA